MLGGWLVLLAVLAGIGSSFAADSRSLLLEEKLWQEGRKFLAEGKAAEAKTTFEKLLKEYPQEANLHLFLGISLLRLREPQAAEAAVRKTLSPNPNHVEARTLLGWIESEIRGDFEAAVREYSKVVELRPDLPEAYNNLGVAQKRKGDLTKAAESFNQALKLKPDYTAAISNRGWVLAEQNQWSGARREFERALAINPGDDGALYGLSQALREEKDYAGAQNALGRLIARSPNFVYWLEWGRIGLIRYWWILLLAAIMLFMKGRLKKVRSQSNGG
ncbi:MAG TPA: tetratricopeptide repeat protein [Candidatus Binatia bacterium]|nr:tetratricopeptide repeat protein [Candidatus Binatia bacterium]